MTNIQVKGTAPSRVIRLPRVCELTGAARATIWRWAKDDPSFPQPFKVSAGISAWDEQEVFAWIEAKKSARNIK